MKIIQTYWTGPRHLLDKDTLAITAGWMGPEFHWMSWALSCLLLKQRFGRVELVTDEPGRAILIDRLNLPYDSVSTALEGRLDSFPGELWSLAKLFSFGAQTEPFLHFDGDLFLFQDPAPELLQAPLVAQNAEVEMPYYERLLGQMHTHFSYLSPALAGVDLNAQVWAANTGIFGGSDLGFIAAYVREAFDLIEKNREKLYYVETGKLNFIFEQCLLFYMAAAAGKPISYFMPEPVEDPLYPEFIRFIDYPLAQLVHPVGGFKQSYFVCRKMAQRLRSMNPELYYKILGLCRENGIALTDAIYNQPPFNQSGFNPRIFLQANRRPAHEWYKELPEPVTPRPLTFPRTLGLLKLLCPGEDDFSGEWTATRVAARVTEAKESLADEGRKEMLQEIFELEKLLASLADLRCDPAGNTDRYFDEWNAHELNDRFFELTGEELDALRLRAGKEVVFMELNREWRFDGSEEMAVKLAERNLEYEKTPWLLALVPGAGKLTWEEHYLDHLDILVTEAGRGGADIGRIVGEMENCFDAAELEEDYPAFRRLILDTLKRLMDSAILERE